MNYYLEVYMVETIQNEKTLFELADLFKIFGDTTRIKILFALRESELCVSDIAARLGMTQSAISHQLRVLKTNKLAKFRREGKTLFYSLADSHVESILHQGMEHVSE
jgi:ArsR family transcriptional regulator